MVQEQLKQLLTKQHYALVGNHAAVKTCHWTKQSIRGLGNCYKQQFYGIDCHRCLQMTPIVDRCNFNCTFCWRPMDYTIGTPLSPEEADDPELIVEESLKAQKKLLIGFKGSETADMDKLEEALKPNQIAISLAGEPTLYPYLSELINLYKKRDMTTFLVSNGTNPAVLEDLNPTQLYISLSAPNTQLCTKINRPLIKDSWERLQESLGVLSGKKCRTVIRLTLTKSGMIQPEKYAKLIETANPNFVEAKAYMHVGSSEKRLPETEMPEHSDIQNFSKKLSELTSYRYSDEKQDSRVVLLKKD